MWRWVAKFIVAVLVAVAAGVVTSSAINARRIGESSARQPAPVVEADAPLFVPDDQLDVGEVWEAKDARLTIPLHNRTDHDIHVIDFDAACDCKGIVPKRLTVPARGSAEFQVVMDLTLRSPDQTDVPKRVFVARIRPVLGTGERAGAFEVRGVVKSRATINLRSMQFGDSNVAGQPPHPRKAIVTAHVPCEDLVAASDDPCVSATIARLDGNRFQLTVTPDTARPPGPFRTSVRVYSRQDERRQVVWTGIGVDGQLCDH